ncbi:hypothetical protein M3664_08120 [Paenibacillus lautus]|uniref:hypothetical protein n=1 Tax=Paenibacillus TaxID=44249 RepID=UPI00203A4FBD|nr:MULTISPECIES: hypothetical protein [Paenibacillus]MCM3257759.1 hypothetical protein [Paenibacillus lautus]
MDSNARSIQGAGSAIRTGAVLVVERRRGDGRANPVAAAEIPGGRAAQYRHYPSGADRTAIRLLRRSPGLHERGMVDAVRGRAAGSGAAGDETVVL